MKPETIKIDEVECIRKDSLPKASEVKDGETYHGLNLIVLDRGFVYVGYVKTDKDWCYIDQASNIRVWGTSKGLSELIDGPTSSTKLDKAGSVKASIRSLIHLIACKESIWSAKL